MAFGDKNSVRTDPRVEATIGQRLASTVARQDGAYFTAETIMALAVQRVAILDSNGDVAEASACIRGDLGRPWNTRTAAPAQHQTALATPESTAVEVRNDLLTEWQSIAEAVRHGARAHMAYQFLGGLRHRLLFIPLAAWGDVRTSPTGQKPVFADGKAGGRGAVGIVACRTLCGDGELLDVELEHVCCDYGTLGELACLTIRELDALRMLGFGYKVARISRPLHCSSRRTSDVLRNMRAKLNVTDNFKLAVIAIRSGLIDIDDQAWQRTVFIRQS